MMPMKIYGLCTYTTIYTTIYNIMHAYAFPNNGLVIPKLRPVTYYSHATGKMIS